MATSLSALRASLLPSVQLQRGRGRGGGRGERGSLTVRAKDGATLTLTGLSPNIAAAVRCMRGRGTSIAMLRTVVAADGNVEGQLAWRHAVRALESTGMLQYTVTSDAGPIARLTPISPHYRAEFTRVPRRARLRLSRFALVRRADGGRGWVLESPLALSRIELLHPWSLTWLHALSAPLTLAALARGTAARARPAQDAFIALLYGAGFLTSEHARERSHEDQSAPLATWEFSDALTHARSRRGRHNHAYGEVYPFRGRLAPLPCIKPPMSTDVVSLGRPKGAAPGRDDPRFSRVLEARRSLRAHGRRAIDVRQLGEFLYRTARVQKVLEGKELGRPHDLSLRASPGGGACHELELYIVANRCAGLTRGLYHYDPLRHVLERLETGAGTVQALLDDCPAPENAPPPASWHVLIVITARFQRVSWKYRGLSYTTVLKDVGALMQTMYLVATAMRLAPCALGGGDSERFARAIGADFFEETSVGEFLIGTRVRQRTPRSAPLAT